MAKNYFYEYTPKTAKYIDSCDDERALHHNHVIEQRYLNSKIAVADMTKAQQQAFDRDCLKNLLFLDLPKNEYTRIDIIKFAKVLLKNLGKRSKVLDNIDTLYQQQSFGYCHNALYSAMYDYLSDL